MKHTSGSRHVRLSLASAGMAVALVALAPAAAQAEGWRNWSNVACGSAKVQTASWSTGLTEHFQRTVGGAEWKKSWDNMGIPQERRHSFGLSTLSFAQVWTSHLLIRGDLVCV